MRSIGTACVVLAGFASSLCPGGWGLRRYVAGRLPLGRQRADHPRQQLSTARRLSLSSGREHGVVDRKDEPFL